MSNKDKVACASAKNTELLKARQGYPLKAKVMLTNERIIEWYEHFEGGVYISFSGGKDSTALLHLVRSIYPDVPAVFFDTGLEFPEIREFVKTIDNVEWIKPKLNFKETLNKYGFPVVSKEVSQKISEIRTTKSEKLLNIRLHGNDKGHGKVPEKWKYLADAPFDISNKCCDTFKKNPAKGYEKRTGRKAFIGTMASESSGRLTSYLTHGCNSFSENRPVSMPMSFWLESDVWDYIKLHDLPYAKVYDMGYDRTGCMFCMFGVHLEKGENRFQRMAVTHPKQHSYCMDKLGLRDVLAYVGVTEVDAIDKSDKPEFKGIKIIVDTK